MTLATSSTNIGIPAPTQLPGVFTVATLPSLPGANAGSYTAYTSDGGLCQWNGASWGSGAQRKLVSKMRALLAQAQTGTATPATAQPLITPPPWVLGTAYTKGLSVTNGGNNYTCITPGTSAGAGGPAGTGTGPITDNTVQWYYMGPSFASAANAPTYANVLVANRYVAGNFWSNTACTRNEGASQIRDTSNFRVTGTTFTETGGQNSITGNGNAVLMSVSFMTDAPQLQIVCGSSTTYIQVYVNGVPVTLGYGGLQTTPLSVYWQLVFPTGPPTPRLITVEIGAVFSFYGVMTNDLTSKVWAPYLSNSFRMAIVGTSYIAGSPWHPVTQSLGWGSLTAKLLNCSDIYQDVTGAGSGYIAPGGSGNFSTPSRLTALAAYNPDLVVIAGGGINDRAVGGITLAIEQAAVRAYLLQVRAILPAAIIMVIGSEAGSTGPQAAIFTMEAAAAAAVAALNDVNTVFIPQSNVSAQKAWISGTGTVAAPNTTGNSDLYISTDGIHPVQAGCLYLSQQSANGVINQINSFAA